MKWLTKSLPDYFLSQVLQMLLVNDIKWLGKGETTQPRFVHTVQCQCTARVPQVMLQEAHG